MSLWKGFLWWRGLQWQEPGINDSDDKMEVQEVKWPNQGDRLS